MHTSFFGYAHEKFPVCTRETFGVHTDFRKPFKFIRTVSEETSYGY